MRFEISIHMSNHHRSQDDNISVTSKSFFLPLCFSSFWVSAWTASLYFLLCPVFLVMRTHIKYSLAFMKQIWKAYSLSYYVIPET